MFGFTQGMPLADWVELRDWTDPVTATPLPDEAGRPGWGGAVTVPRLLGYLRALGEWWVGTGVARQVAAFRAGLGELASLNAGALAFEPAELR